MIRGMYIHTVTLQKASAGDVGYGHTSYPNWNSVTEYSGILCRYSTRRISEYESSRRQNVVSEYAIFIPKDEAPAGIDTPGNELWWRVKDVKDADGNIINSGPVDIEGIESVYGVRGRIMQIKLTLKGVE